MTDGWTEFEHAVDGFTRSGAPFEAAQARLALALPELTPREREVLALLAEGLTNRGIAEQLVVSEHTVHRHVTRILAQARPPLAHRRRGPSRPAPACKGV